MHLKDLIEGSDIFLILPLSFPRRRPFDKLTVLSEVEGDSRKYNMPDLDARPRPHGGRLCVGMTERVHDFSFNFHRIPVSLITRV